jgi:hypothetical protein
MIISEDHIYNSVCVCVCVEYYISMNRTLRAKFLNIALLALIVYFSRMMMVYFSLVMMVYL